MMGHTLPERSGRLSPTVYRVSALRSNVAVHQAPHYLVRTNLVNAIRMPVSSHPRVKKLVLRWGPRLDGPAPHPAGSVSRLPVKPQHRHSIDLAGLLGRPTATRSATAAATHPAAQHGEEAAPGWGTSPTPLPIWAWPGTPSPVQSYTRLGSIRCHSHGESLSPSSHPPLAICSTRRPFLDAFLANFGAIWEGFRATPGMAL